MRRHYNEQTFRLVVDNEPYVITAYTNDQYDGFTENVECRELGLKARQKWENRSWQRFDYESALLELIDKMPKAWRETAHAQLIEHKAVEVEAEVEQVFQDFKQSVEELPDDLRQRLANSDVHIKSLDDARMLTGLNKMFTLMCGMSGGKE